MDFYLDLQKCRCCFRLLVDESKAITITEIIEERFYNLTEIELIKHDTYSNIICELCDKDLKSFYHLKKDLQAKQQILYQNFPIQPAAGQDFIETFEDIAVEDEVKMEVFPADNVVENQAEKSIRKPRKQALNSTTDEVNEQRLDIFCEICNQKLSSKISLKRHIDRVHFNKRNFFCDHCSYSAFFKHNLEKHISKHIPDQFRDRFKCNSCDFVSISAVNIELHKKYEHSEVKTLFVCAENDCQKTFARPGQLTAHVRLTHEKRKDKVCGECQKKFSTTTRLKEHMLSQHSPFKVREFACEFCPKRFMTARQLQNHQVYHDEPKYKCQLGCDKKFYKLVLLEGHHKTHSGSLGKNFICPIEGCGRKYFLKNHLSRHVQSIHEMIKMQCEICSAKFVRKESYRAHVLSQHQELSKAKSDALLRKIRLMKINKS